MTIVLPDTPDAPQGPYGPAAEESMLQAISEGRLTGFTVDQVSIAFDRLGTAPKVAKALGVERRQVTRWLREVRSGEAYPW